MDKEVKEKLESLAKLSGNDAILPQVLLELIEANEKAQKHLDDISTKMQEAQEDIKTETKNIDEKLIEANENAKIRLDDISTKIQEAQEDIKIEMKDKLGITDANFNQAIKKSLSSMTSSLSKKIIWCFVGIAVLIIVATLAVVKYIV